MKRFAIASALALGLAASSLTALADDDANGDDSADVERGVATLRVTSQVDKSCNIWVNGMLRATIGPRGDSGILATGNPPERMTEIVAACEGGDIWRKKVKVTYNHCDFVIPRHGENALAVGVCN